jgi:hypothetical protein
MKTAQLSPGEILLWACLKNFNPREAWGDYSKMDPVLLFIHDAFRSTLPAGCWIKVHCGYKDTGHTKNSYHYSGKAIDWHVEGINPVEAERYLMKFLKTPIFINNEVYKLINYMGVGLYPEWITPGFHTDIRGTRANWSRIGGKYAAYSDGVEALKQRYND